MTLRPRCASGVKSPCIGHRWHHEGRPELRVSNVVRVARGRQWIDLIGPDAQRLQDVGDCAYMATVASGEDELDLLSGDVSD